MQQKKFCRHLDSYIDKQFFSFIYFFGTRPSETMASKFSDIKGNYVCIEHNLQRRGTRKIDTPKNQSSIHTLKLSWLMKFREIKAYLYETI